LLVFRLNAFRSSDVPHPKPTLLRLFPFLRWWPQVDRGTLKDDALAGLSGALIVLPQGVAFATIAGMPPEYGLYAAMVPAVIAALFGSSWHLVSGPTTAISIAVFAAMSHLAEPGSPEYIGMVLTLTMLVGVFQLALGLARMGALVNFISHTVVIGFTAGAAVLIAASQVRNFFGIAIPRGTPFYEILRQFIVQLGDINPYVTAVGAVTLATGIAMRRFVPKFPYMIAAMILGGLAALALDAVFGNSVTGIATVGALPSHLPPLSMPDFSGGTLRKTLVPALVITMLALTEAVSIARAIAVRSEQRIDGNQEFIGQGLSNIVGTFFSAYASSGSFNRSGVNFEAGARTPLASVFASIALALVVLLVAPLAAYLPTAAMAGILFLVAWGLIDFHHIRSIWRTSKQETAVMWITLVGTLINLEAGILAGVLLSLVLYLNRTSRPAIEPQVPSDEAGSTRFVPARGRPECPQLRIVRIHGSLFFGAVDHVQAGLQQIDEDNPQHRSVLVVATGINFVDVAGAETLAQEARRRRRLGGGLYFYGLKENVHAFLRQGEDVKDIGEGALFPLGSKATGALYWTLDPEICRTCTKRIFAECRRDVLPDGLRRQRLMLASDGTEHSAAPTAIAIALAHRFGVTLDIMTMVGSEAERQIGSLRLGEIDRAATRAGVICEPVVRSGTDPVGEVIGAAEDADTNILIIGRRPPPKGIAGRMIGDVAARIIASAPCNVLVAGPAAAMWQRRILLATDGSRFSEAATELVSHIAKATSVPVTVISVAREGGRSREQVEQEATYTAGLLKTVGIAAEAVIGQGKPAEVIVRQAQECGADLIVLGSHGRKGLNRLLLGSVSSQVLGRVECAVLIAKPPSPPEEIISAIGHEL
jgi:SulP family sulfate permease